MLQISADRDAFLRLPAEIYSDERVIAKANAGIDRASFRDTQRMFVATDGDEVIARTLARQRDGVGMLGYFEAQDDAAAVTALLSTAAQWLRGQGCSRVIGPIDGDTWHRYRVTAGPWEMPPFLLEPVNPQYYSALWEQAGWRVTERYVSQRIDDVEELAVRLAPIAERALRKGYTIRAFDRTRIEDELAIVWKLSTDIFVNNAFYAPIDLPDFLALYEGIERLLVNGLVIFGEDRDGAAAGFLFAYPDREAGVINFKTLGVTPQHRGSGLAVALQHHGYATALSLGARTANHCLIREGNRSESMDAGYGHVFRHYLLYELP